MLPYRDSRITILSLLVFFVALIAYAYFEASGALLGPAIELESVPQSVASPLVALKGQASTIAELRINGNSVPVTEDGAFEEPYLLAPGFNRIVFEARDQYGRTAEEIISIRYVPSVEVQIASSVEEATSTPEVLPEEE